VFVNLIKNAREALADSDRRELHVTYRERGETIEVEIRDTGPGIPEADLASVFDPFFTTKEVGEGLGLGLSISSGILRDMGGSIRAHNHPDGGAVFTVELPRAEADVRTRSA
jgi:two-component system, NtrC family, C4-dicarboxylate transport sensor histidine kinase DctB